MPSATANTSTLEAALRATLAATCPASTGRLPMSMARKRSMMPPVMSRQTVTAVLADPTPAHSSSTPGTT